MKRSVKISQKLFNELLKRETMYDVISRLNKQNNVFDHGEKLVLLGSALASFESHTYTAATPIHRAPNDIDFYLYEPKGEKGRFGSRMSSEDRIKHKESQIHKMKSALKQVAAEFDGSVTTRRSEDDEMNVFDSELLGNKSYEVIRPWTLDEIKDRFKSPMVTTTLKKILGNNSDEFEIVNLDELYEQRRKKEFNAHPHATRCPIEVQMVAYPMSFLKPLPLSGGQSENGEGGLLMADDTLNTLALKLVRLVLPDYSRQLESDMPNASGMKGRARNMLDIHDIMNLRREKNLPPIDVKKLRVLFLAHLAYQNQMEIEGASLEPLLDKKRLKESISNYIHDEDKPVSGHIPDTLVDRIAQETMRLIDGMFPNRGASDGLSLSRDEIKFIALSKGTHSEKIEAKSTRGERSFLFQHPHLATELLANIYPDEFESLLRDDPEFKQRIATNWTFRPRHGGLDDAIMADAVYPPGKEPRKPRAR